MTQHSCTSYYGNSHIPLPLPRVLDHQEASHWLTDSWVRRCGCGDLHSHSTFQCTHVASQPRWSLPSGHRLPSWMEQMLVKNKYRIGMGSGDARVWNWNLPYISAFSRKALAFCPSSPEKALLKSSISMASCLVLSMKLFLINPRRMRGGYGRRFFIWRTLFELSLCTTSFYGRVQPLTLTCRT